jgi:hypothetical protein
VAKVARPSFFVYLVGMVARLSQKAKKAEALISQLVKGTGESCLNKLRSLYPELYLFYDSYWGLRLYAKPTCSGALPAYLSHMASEVERLLPGGGARVVKSRTRAPGTVLPASTMPPVKLPLTCWERLLAT